MAAGWVLELPQELGPRDDPVSLQQREDRLDVSRQHVEHVGPGDRARAGRHRVGVLEDEHGVEDNRLDSAPPPAEDIDAR